MSNKRVLVVAMGGTIAMTRSPSGGIEPSLSAEELVSVVPGLARLAEIETASPFQLPGASLTLAHLSEVARLITTRAGDGIDGVVLVQGTDTIEETAFILDRLIAPGLPVVVTGAMRGPETPGADGPANLAAAVIVAGSEAARGLGVLVVLNDEVHAARFVRKGHTGLPSAFTSAPHGPIGHVIEERILLGMRPVRASGAPLASTDEPPPVALVQVGLGDDGRIIPALPDLGYRGAVIAAMGAGHVPQALVEPLTTLAKVMPVVLGTRVFNGPVFAETYGFIGSERDLLGRGLIRGGALGPIKTRLLLQLAIASGFSEDELSSLFSHE